MNLLKLISAANIHKISFAPEDQTILQNLHAQYINTLSGLSKKLINKEISLKKAQNLHFSQTCNWIKEICKLTQAKDPIKSPMIMLEGGFARGWFSFLSDIDLSFCFEKDEQSALNRFLKSLECIKDSGVIYPSNPVWETMNMFKAIDDNNYSLFEDPLKFSAQSFEGTLETPVDKQNKLYFVKTEAQRMDPQSKFNVTIETFKKRYIKYLCEKYGENWEKILVWEKEPDRSDLIPYYFLNRGILPFRFGFTDEILIYGNRKKFKDIQEKIANIHHENLLKITQSEKFKKQVQSYKNSINSIESAKLIDKQISDLNSIKYSLFYPILFIAEYFNRKYNLKAINLFDILEQIPAKDLEGNHKNIYIKSLKLLANFRYVTSALVWSDYVKNNKPIQVTEMQNKLKDIFDDNLKAKCAEILNFSSYPELEKELIKAIQTVKNTSLELLNKIS